MARTDAKLRVDVVLYEEDDVENFERVKKLLEREGGKELNKTQVFREALRILAEIQRAFNKENKEKKEVTLIVRKLISRTDGMRLFECEFMEEPSVGIYKAYRARR